MKKVFTIAVVSILLAFSSLADNTSAKEFGAISKIASLCKTFKQDPIKLYVVYNKNNAQTVIDKENILQYFKFSNILVQAQEIKSIKNLKADVIVLANGLSVKDQQYIAKNFYDTKTLTVSTDLTCVEKGYCVLGVEIGTIVKLFVNSTKYMQSGLKFDPAFEFMVKQI